MDLSVNPTAPTLAVGADSGKSAALPPHSPSSVRTVLIVDDNQDNLQLASFVAEQQGYRVLLAASADETFSQIRHHIDLVLLDIVLPDMDGFSVLERLRSMYQFAINVPVVAVTALASAQEKRAISEAGFSGYLCKPYTIDALEQVLKQFCFA
ncbi:response regulator [filamentous cyanobacterium CCP5]|nr:response regulator [filamentous cyanobacterium CCP5]